MSTFLISNGIIRCCRKGFDQSIIDYLSKCCRSRWFGYWLHVVQRIETCSYKRVGAVNTTHRTWCSVGEISTLRNIWNIPSGLMVSLATRINPQRMIRGLGAWTQSTFVHYLTFRVGMRCCTWRRDALIMDLSLHLSLWRRWWLGVLKTWRGNKA